MQDRQQSVRQAIHHANPRCRPYLGAETRQHE